MSRIYNYFYNTDYTFEPTSALKHQHFLICEQVLKSNIKLKSVSDQIELEKKNELSWKLLIQQRKLKRRNPKNK